MHFRPMRRHVQGQSTRIPLALRVLAFWTAVENFPPGRGLRHLVFRRFDRSQRQNVVMRSAGAQVPLIIYMKKHSAKHLFKIGAVATGHVVCLGCSEQHMGCSGSAQPGQEAVLSIAKRTERLTERLKHLVEYRFAQLDRAQYVDQYDLPIHFGEMFVVKRLYHLPFIFLEPLGQPLPQGALTLGGG